MLSDHSFWLTFAVALGIGLLIGADRERKKADENQSAAAGIRTFTIATLLGAVSATMHVWLLAVSIVCVTIFATTAYFVRRDKEPALTTEVTLIFTVLLGGLTVSSPALAASLAVSAAILLAAKEPIHGFVRVSISRDEMIDFLILAAATLIILPLVPNAFVGPFNAINPHNLWLIVILVMVIGAFGHLALRCLGGRLGLPIVGFVSGFVSSIATIGAMGGRAKKTPALIHSAIAGATLSNLSTIFLLATLLGVTHPPTLHALMLPLVFGGIVVATYGAVITLRAFHDGDYEQQNLSRSFSVKTALTLAAMIAVVLMTSAALKNWFGQAGLVLASAVAGLADVHASTISVASLAASGSLAVAQTVVPILVAFSVNAVSKAIAALLSGGKAFALPVIIGLILQVSATWLAWFFL